MQPLLLEADLGHVDVVRGDGFVATGDALVLGGQGVTFGWAKARQQTQERLNLGGLHAFGPKAKAEENEFLSLSWHYQLRCHFNQPDAFLLTRGHNSPSLPRARHRLSQKTPETKRRPDRAARHEHDGGSDGTKVIIHGWLLLFKSHPSLMPALPKHSAVSRLSSIASHKHTNQDKFVHLSLICLYSSIIVKAIIYPAMTHYHKASGHSN